MAGEKGQSGELCSVGCKLPHGLKLDLNQPGQPRHRVVIKGTNSAAVIGGFGITENVSASFFAEWLKRNKELPAVKHGLIFALPSARSVADKALELAELKHGAEPIDPKAPGKGIAKLRTDGEVMADAEG